MRIIVLLSMLLCLPLHAAGTSVPAGSKLSLALEKAIIKAGFTPSRIPLANTAKDLFPFNIAVDFPATLPAGAEDARTQLIIDLLQEDAYSQQEAFTAFLGRLQKKQYDFDITVLCAAGDIAPAGLENRRMGSREYAASIADNEHTAAITVQTGAKNELSTGSYRRTTPRWLSQAIVQAFYAEKQRYAFPRAVTSFYRLGYIRASERMEAFMSAQIPAAEVTLAEGSGFSVLVAVCDNYPSLAQTAFWDSHYLLLPFFYPLRTIILSERFFVLAALILGTLAVLLLCVFSFSGSSARTQRRHFKRAWFMLPLTLTILFLAIITAQALSRRIPAVLAASPIPQLGTKIAVSLLIISLVFAVLDFLHAPVESFIYGDASAYIAAGNIFFFSAIDLQFFLPLLIEYSIVYIARRSRKLLPLVLATVIMFIPFMPYIYAIMNANNKEAIAQLIFCGYKLNLLLALLFFPFQLIWLRILLWFKLHRHIRKKSSHNFLIHNAISAGVLLALTLLVILPLSILSRSITEQTPRATIIQRDRNTIAVKNSRTTFSDLTTEHISISSAVDAVRYEISLETKGDDVPLYDSSYEFTLNDATNRAQFILPDYPPNTITIDYAFSSEAWDTLTVQALYRTDTPTVYRQETQVITIAGQKAAETKKEKP